MISEREYEALKAFLQHQQTAIVKADGILIENCTRDVAEYEAAKQTAAEGLHLAIASSHTPHRVL